MKYVKVTERMIREMRSLRANGWSHDRIAEYLGVSRDTALRYAPGGHTVRRSRIDDGDAFTQEMLALGEQIMAKLRAEGKVSD